MIHLMLMFMLILTILMRHPDGNLAQFINAQKDAAIDTNQKCSGLGVVAYTAGLVN